MHRIFFATIILALSGASLVAANKESTILPVALAAQTCSTDMECFALCKEEFPKYSDWQCEDVMMGVAQ